MIFKVFDFLIYTRRPVYMNNNIASMIVWQCYEKEAHSAHMM